MQVHKAKFTKTVSHSAGNENTLHECSHDAWRFCPATGGVEVAAVVCTEIQADLEPDIYALMSSTHLEDKPLFLLQVRLLSSPPLALYAFSQKPFLFVRKRGLSGSVCMY